MNDRSAQPPRVREIRTTNRNVFKTTPFFRGLTYLNVDTESGWMKEEVKHQCCRVPFSIIAHRFVQLGYNFQLDIRDARVPLEWLDKKKHKN